ncbi:hypothetical protein ACUY3K_06020 [Corynebacterium uberis]|uniref:hypothetical protein n=1 Tax=Corynebacterium TaxID=1716 RepID=UPI001D0AD9BF|nr:MULTISPECIES: hypothetical protein [Corynebacterium]MCZ9308249.1 hypothetical protein [Corynebacterium sp. c6VSa_13]UDL73929.1 hypothetical protein LH391_01490 [Corynebacterium uberis]UDL75188.1 hypothetical protein LH393_07925 [Corynebacterium uberis]UDL77399.1 hypothetical protein LH394_07905 [Corynebacterium uberis]UDL79684.1 hypothetical protein LH392_08330 [Corynebacterium uberis]
MSLTLSLDCTSATLADVESLVAAARAAGAPAQTRLRLVDSNLTLELPAGHAGETDAARAGADSARSGGPAQSGAHSGGARPASRGDGFGGAGNNPMGGVGEAAVRSVIDILTGRQDPTR